MSKRQVMKEILSEKINQDKIYQNVLRKVGEKEMKNIKNIRNRKVIYGIISSVAMLVLGVGIITYYSRPLNNETETNQEKTSIVQDDNIVFNTESIKSEASISGKVVDIDGDWKDADIIEQFDFLQDIDILKKYQHLNQGMVYVKENVEDTDYSKLHQYQLIYYMDGNNAPTTEIMFTKEDRILQCMLPNEDDFPSSTINGHEVKLSKSENFFESNKINGEAFFEYKGYKFYIESHRIDENDFVDLVKAILEQE